MMLSVELWDRLAYHALLPLAESIAGHLGISVEHVVFGRGMRAILGRQSLERAMVRRAGWSEDGARALLRGAADGSVPVADRRPGAHVSRCTPPTPFLASVMTSEEAMRESAMECSERWAE